MNSYSRVALAFIAAALAVPSAAWAQSAGRVLLAIGDVFIERGAQRIAARVGTEVQTGDQIQVGTQSNAQVRFSDESIVSLRPETTFKLSEYAYAAQDPSKQRAFMELVRGGIRTVTGAIGRLRQDDYRVTTPTSTIGIRGTHYTIVECAAACRNGDGSAAPPGTYGSVTDGRIGVTNRAGETVFGADQYFHVPSADAAPRQLVAPPGFLRDTLEGRARSQQARAPSGDAPKPAATQQSQGGGQQSQGGQQTQGGPAQGQGTGNERASAVAQTGLGATVGDTAVSSSVSTPALAVLPSTTLVNTVIQSETLSSTGTSSVLPSSVLPSTITTPVNTYAGTIFYRLAGPFSIPVVCTSGSCTTLTRGEIILGVNFTLQRAALRLAIGDAAGVANVALPFGADLPITVSNGTVSFSGTVNAADYPTEGNAFLCSNCGVNGTVSKFISLSVSGSITGSTATLRLSGTDPTGTRTFNATLTQATLPNTDVGATVIPRQSVGSSTTSGAFWDVGVNASRQLTAVGPPIGALAAKLNNAGGASVTGTDAAGSLTWGLWSSGSYSVTDSSYVTWSPNYDLPWINGAAMTDVPASLGSASYTMLGGIVNGSTQLGNTGMLMSGSLSADFLNRKMTIDLSALNSSLGVTFGMAGSSGINPVNGRFGAAFSTVSCTGNSCGYLQSFYGAPYGSFAGFFAGSKAEGAGIAFSAGFNSHSPTGVAGVAAFKR